MIRPPRRFLVQNPESDAGQRGGAWLVKSAFALWIATWAASLVAAEPDPGEPLLNLDRQTVREHVRVSIGGEKIRVRLSNDDGATPLAIGSATVGRTIDAASVEPGSVWSLTFGARSTVTIPARSSILSDPVDLTVAPGEPSIWMSSPNRARR